ELGALRQCDRLRILVIALPIEIPILDPEQPSLFAIGKQSVPLQIFTEIVSVRVHSKQAHVHWQHIAAFRHVIRLAGRDIKFKVQEADAKRKIGGGLVTEIKTNAWLHGLWLTGGLHMHLENQVRIWSQ